MGFTSESTEQHGTKRGGNLTTHKDVSADGKKVTKQAGPDYGTLESGDSRREKSDAAKARARNNSYRDANSNLGRGLPAEVTIGK